MDQNEDKLTRYDILENFTDELQMLEDFGFSDQEQNIDGLIKYNGILGFLKALYPELDFEKFEQKTLNKLVIPIDAYIALLSVNGDSLKAMEICAPFLHQNYLEIQEAGFTNEKEIIGALYYNTDYYNVASDAVIFLKRKEVYSKQNQQMRNEFGCKDDELNFLKLFETKGNIIEAVMLIDPKKIYDPIVKKLNEKGLKYDNIENFENLVLNELKDLDNTVAYIKLLEKGKINDEAIEEVMRDYTYAKKYEMLEGNNWDPYKAVVSIKNPDIYSTYKNTYSPMFIYYASEGVSGDLSEFEKHASESNKILSTMKQYGLNLDDPFLNLNVLVHKLPPIAVFNLIDKQAAKQYLIDLFMKKGYKESVISISHDFQDFDDDLVNQEELIKLVADGKLKVLKDLKEELGNEDFVRDFTILVELLNDNDFNLVHTLFEYKKLPFEYKEQITNKETLDAFCKFNDIYNSIVSGGYPNYDLLFKNDLDANLGVLNNLFESCYAFIIENKLHKKYKTDRLFKLSHEAADDVETFKKLLKKS